MKCAKLHLRERLKPKARADSCQSRSVEKPRRYCQKRMVNPEHEEDPRWTDVYKRFHCDPINEALESARINEETEDLFLTVQTLKFQGESEETKRSRSTSFKYKTPTNGVKHRMFVKQAIPDNEYSDDDRSSQLTCYYFDDYVKYLFSNDKSRPTSAKSSIFLQGLSNKKENKATQLSVEQTGEGNKILRKVDSKVKSLFKECDKPEIKDEIKNDGVDAEDTKIIFRKSGKRKSLTISRAQSPETVQVIRVDVVCNYSFSSAMSDYEDKKECTSSKTDINIESMRHSHFANKYLLKNTIKTLDENLSGGAKVTLLCKTFKLSERAKTLSINKLKTNSDDKTNFKDSKKCSENKSCKRPK